MEVTMNRDANGERSNRDGDATVGMEDTPQPLPQEQRRRPAAAPAVADDECPLFMTALPSRATFDTSSKLQALCNLAGGGDDDDDDDDDDDSEAPGPATVAKRGGGQKQHSSGKAKRQTVLSKARTKAHPYHGGGVRQSERQRRRASAHSAGEAQIYMSFLGLPSNVA
jgi:hypothetical protein